MKICTCCGLKKSEAEFNHKKNTKDGLDCKCKACQKLYDMSRRESKKIYDKTYREQNKDKIKAYSELYEQRPERIQQKKINNRIYNQTHKEHIREYERLYKQTEAGKLATQRKNQNRQKLYSSNMVFHLNHKIGVCISNTLKTQNFDSKNLEWPVKVGYTAKELKKHLESQFTSKMSWLNYGEYWELDHIIPKDSFTFNSYEDKAFKICWSLMNLRPLTISENRSRPHDGSDILKDTKDNIMNQGGDWFEA